MGTERETPETDAKLLTVEQRTRTTYLPEMVYADFARQLERQRNELRELYALDTQCLRTERDEAREALASVHDLLEDAIGDNRTARDSAKSICTRLQTVRDEAFGAAPVETADQNITAIEDGITALRMENQALREALRNRIENRYCSECRYDLDAIISHAETCRHHATEKAVLS